MTDRAARVLVVEDDPGKRYTIVRELRAQGFEVWEAATGQEGLRRARDLPDVIVLDLFLPDISGFEVARSVKADPTTASILILELTARFATPSDRVRGLDEGADAYLIHPIDATELVATVRSLLRLRQAERERALLAAELEAGERRYRTVTETATVGLFQIDGEGRCTFMNRAAETINGHSFSEISGRVLHDVLHPVHREPASQTPCPVRVITESGPVREVRDSIQRKDGKWIPVRLSASPILLGGRQIGAVLEIKDDTDLVRAEQARDLFLATLGHDLRGPLHTVALATNLLERNPVLTEKDHGMLQRITASTTRMRRLIDHMLVFAQALVEGVPLMRQTTDLAALCADVARDATLTAAERAIEVSGPTELRGNWDADRLLQVIDNLVGNAIRHGEGPIRIELEADDDTAVLSVHNRGKPIPADALSTVFDPFRRADGRSKGTGLGLYIVDSIVRAHGGTIEVTSSADHGTCFRVRLPRWRT